MAAIASAQAGNWSSASTWTGGVVPGDGDTVTLNHDVTVDVNVTVGDSGAAGGTAAIRCAGGDLTKPDGVNLTVRGDLTCANYRGVTFGDGVVEFNASLSASPSTTSYKFETAYRGKLTATGTTIRSNAGGANARMLTTYANDYTYLTDVTFQRMGLASGSGLIFAGMEDSASGDVVLLRCTFDENCGSVVTGVNQATSRLEVVDCEFNQTTGQTDYAGFTGKNVCWRNSTSSTPTGAGTRLITGSRFNALAVLLSSVGFTIDRCVFMTPPSIFTAWTELKRSLVAYPSGTGDFGSGGPQTDVYHLADGITNNWHAVAITPAADDVIDGLAFDPFTLTNASDSGECLMVTNPASARTLRVKRCIVLPGENEVAGRGDRACAGALVWLKNAATNLTLICEHNTVYQSIPENATYVTAISSCGENHTPAAAGAGSAHRSNLAWAAVTGRANQCKDVNKTGAVANTFLASGTTHNGGHNLADGYDGNPPGYDYVRTGAAPGASDVIGDPGLSDPYRNIKTWAQSLSLSGATPAELKDAAIAHIWADPTRIDDLFTHVRAGQAPTDADFQADYESSVPTTSPTNGWIGAVEGIASTVSASRSRLINAGAFGGSRAALVHAGGA
jgi:hypothetical protein